MTDSRRLLLPVLLLAATACATASTGSGTRPGGSRDVITTAEIRESPHLNAYDLVRSLRPRWLRIRGSGSINRPEFVKVYRDGNLIGPPGALAQISVQQISQIRFLDGFAATQRFGTDHGNGAILVTTGS